MFLPQDDVGSPSVTAGCIVWESSFEGRPVVRPHYLFAAVDFVCICETLHGIIEHPRSFFCMCVAGLY